MFTKMTYPGFPEYILMNLISKPTEFKRGATLDNIHNNEFEKWHDFFCSAEYTPPQNKNIAFFQSCTWSKPYDFSYIGYKIREITNKYNKIHPLIMSNAGIIPYEYQLNPTFCAYDWILSDHIKLEEKKKIYTEYTETLLKRIDNYLFSNKKYYEAVIHYGLPVKNAIAPKIKKICNQHNLPYYIALQPNTYLKLREKMIALKDQGEIYIMDEALHDLNNTLMRVSVKHGSSHNYPSL